MLLRLQFTAQTFAHMLRVRFAQQNLCIGQIDDTYVVDRVEITDTMLDYVFTPADPPFVAGAATTVSVPDADGNPVPLAARELTFTQPVHVFVTTMSDLTANPGAAPPVLPVKVFLVFSIALNGSSLDITYQTLSHTDLLPSAVPIAELESLLKSNLPPIQASLDLTSALDNIGGPPLTTVFTALGATPDVSVIELRVELQPQGALGSADFEAWQAFFNAVGVDDLTAGSDWAMMVDRDILTAVAQSKVQSALTGGDKFTLTSAVVPTWEPSEPGVSIAFTGDVKDACDCAWGSIDVSTDITIDARFSVNDAALQQDLYLTPSPHFWPTVCCEITAALLWPLFVVEGNYNLEYSILGSIAYYYFGPLAIFAAAVLLVHAPVPSETIPNCTQDPADNSHFTCRIGIDLNGTAPYCSKRDDWMAIAGVRGIDQGLVLSGTYTDNALAPPIVEIGNVSPFAWQPPAVNCSGTTGTWVAEASVEVQRGSGDLDLFFCSAVAVGITAPEFQPLLTVDFTYCPLTATVRIRSERFLDDGCSVLILTSGGARLVNFVPMQPLGQDQETSFLEYANRWRLETCTTTPVPFWEIMKIKWLIDPYPGLTKYERLHEIIAWEVAERAVLRVVGARGETLAEGSPNAAGSVQLSLAVPSDTDIGIMAIPPAGRTNVRATTQLKVRQRLLVALDTLRLASPVLAFTVNPNARGSRTVTVVTADHIVAYTIGQSGRFVLAASQHAPSTLVGAELRGGALTGWDEAGTMWQLDPYAARPAVRGTEGRMALSAAARSTDLLARYYAGATPIDRGSVVAGQWLVRVEGNNLALQLFRLAGTAEL
jgi:hypothetical protein